jgi:hypothetical protein
MRRRRRSIMAQTVEKVAPVIPGGILTLKIDGPLDLAVVQTALNMFIEGLRSGEAPNYLIEPLESIATGFLIQLERQI